jgi:hypothetical protein
MRSKIIVLSCYQQNCIAFVFIFHSRRFFSELSLFYILICFFFLIPYFPYYTHRIQLIKMSISDTYVYCLLFGCCFVRACVRVWSQECNVQYAIAIRLIASRLIRLEWCDNASSQIMYICPKLFFLFLIN